MKTFIKTLRGLASLFLYFCNTIFWCTPLFLLTILKFLIPLTRFRLWCSRTLSTLATGWVGANTINQRLFSKTTLDVQCLQELSLEKKYLVLANHQSWVDILVLQRIFHRKIPFLKFFMKKELILFPILGQAWRAHDYPNMKSYTKNFLKKKKQLKLKNKENKTKAYEK